MLRHRSGRGSRGRGEGLRRSQRSGAHSRERGVPLRPLLLRHRQRPGARQDELSALMKLLRLIACVGLSTAVAGHLAAQNQSASTANWALHNLDLAGTRYSPMTQINRTNVKSLAPRWL